MSAHDALKQIVSQAIDQRRQELVELSLRIHSHPETAFQEHRAARWLADYLEANGFRVERGICGIETAFRATYGSGRPHIAFLAEYDALPGIGHGCGHNIIGTSSVAAGIAAKAAVDALGGTIFVIGTPAEEAAGGKVYMAARGAFDGLDCAMLVHPASRDSVVTYALACLELDVEFFGRASHAAAAPELGLNALDAMVIAFSAIGLLRQQVRSDARIHGIITDGGQAVNVIPHHTAAKLLLRALDDDYLDHLRERVLACFRAGAEASGCRLEHRFGDESRYMTMRTNRVLAQVFACNLEALGRRPEEPRERRALGSTDMGNVSHLLPAIHPTVAIAPPEVSIHTEEFREFARSESGHRGLVDAAKALAMTAVDLLADPSLLERAWQEFRQGP
ncbi:MAG TPA: M20 family metallopeptidase [Dehalococcoidia bacterium]|nr:M20 family metallopeptidase [Dehalococcoidia bacterium]